MKLTLIDKDQNLFNKPVLKGRFFSVAVLLLLLVATMTACSPDDQKESSSNKGFFSADSSKEEAESEAAVHDILLSTGGEDALDWSYGEGFCGVSAWDKALKENRSSFDFSVLPSKAEIIEARLEEYGHPYVMDGERFFIFYFQDHHQPWSSKKHGDSTMEKSGCGTVCLSMVLTALTGDIEAYTPEKIRAFMKREHIATPNLSTRSIPVTNRCLKTGIKIKKYKDQIDFDLVDETLKKGGYVIIDQFKYGGDGSANVFAGKNHYMVIRGGNHKKGYYIANPLWAYSSKNHDVKYGPQNYTRIPAKVFNTFYYYTVLP